MKRWRTPTSCGHGGWGFEGLEVGGEGGRRGGTTPGHAWVRGLGSHSPNTFPAHSDRGARGAISKRWWSRGARLRAIARAAGTFHTFNGTNSRTRLVQDMVFEPLSLESGKDVSGVT